MQTRQTPQAQAPGLPERLQAQPGREASALSRNRHRGAQGG
eukprot:CAMPEP_0171285110 /NCGR_PEP_ID=MMETSP0790-20130122/68284_1 /TAXON_ID=2925 /ORGANISM="Alexandrium catenella, Strain OF101" /LENGTH=40 /DNA_ID= /DNA_START= /DNA_END= /DNA_ORIENTATION=